MRNIWSCVEADSWAKGFDYGMYLIHLERCAEQEGANFKPLSEQAYSMLWQALQYDMHKDFTDKEKQ